MFYVRADGNTQIGMGHIMRCLSIAEAALALGKEYKPVFITADEGCTGLIRDRGFEVLVLETDFRDMLSELPALKKILAEGRSVVLVDSYQADTAYFKALSELACVVCLEDMGEPYPVDLLINYNIYAPKLRENYKIGERPLNTLLGVEYMPLRSVFQKDIAYGVRDKVTNVMITTGGSDPYFAADAFAAAFLSAERDMCGEEAGNKIIWHIVSGPFNSFADKLKEKYGGLENVVIHEGLKDLKALMKSCDVVLTATGSTIYEVSALGVPMIAFYFAENQRQGAEAFAELTDVVNAGCFCDDRDGTISRAADALKRCINDKRYRELLYGQERQLIDTKGAARIAEAILKRERLWQKKKADN